MPKTTHRNSVGIFAIFLIALAGVSALAVYVENGHNTVAPELRQQQPVVETSKQPQDQTTVLNPHMDGTDLSFKKETVALPAGNDAKVYAVNEFLHKVPAVPVDALLKSLEIKDGEAILQFNKKFADQSYGTQDEQVLLEGILRTLGQYPEIKTALFQSEGKPIETLGNVSLADPQPVIRDSEKASSAKPIEGP